MHMQPHVHAVGTQDKYTNIFIKVLLYSITCGQILLFEPLTKTKAVPSVET